MKRSIAIGLALAALCASAGISLAADPPAARPDAFPHGQPAAGAEDDQARRQ